MFRNPTEEVERYFRGFIDFIDCTGHQIPRYVDKDTIFTIQAKRRRYLVKN